MKELFFSHPIISTIVLTIVGIWFMFNVLPKLIEWTVIIVSKLLGVVCYIGALGIFGHGIYNCIFGSCSDYSIMGRIIVFCVYIVVAFLVIFFGALCFSFTEPSPGSSGGGFGGGGGGGGGSFDYDEPTPEPTPKPEQSKCKFCDARAYGPGCPFSGINSKNGIKDIHIHTSTGDKCVYCGSRAIGNSCPFSPTGNHSRLA